MHRMPTQELTVRNNQSWELARVPVDEEGTFRKRILEETLSGGRIVNFFGFPEENGDVRL